MIYLVHTKVEKMIMGTFGYLSSSCSTFTSSDGRSDGWTVFQLKSPCDGSDADLIYTIVHL